MKMLQGKRKFILKLALLPLPAPFASRELHRSLQSCQRQLPWTGTMLANHPSWEHTGGLQCSCFRGEESQTLLQLGLRCPGALPLHWHTGSEGSCTLSCSSAQKEAALSTKPQAVEKEQTNRQPAFPAPAAGTRDRTPGGHEGVRSTAAALPALPPPPLPAASRHGQGARPHQRPPQDTSSCVPTLTAFPPDFWSNGTIVIRLDSRSYVQ